MDTFMPRPSYPKTDEDKAKVYLHCMVEVKERLRLVQTVRSIEMPALFIKEVGYLQLRYICELIAIGCLVAQGDYETQRTFRDEYSPPKIFNALRNKYPHFFPQPSTVTSSENHHHLEANSKPGAYVESQVSKLWNASGDHLHRASITSYLKKTFAPAPDLMSLDADIRGIIELLESHIIPIWQQAEQMRLLQVHMEDGTGNVEAHWMGFDLNTNELTISTFRSGVTRG